MSFQLFKDVLHWSLNDLYGWSDTWHSFVEGRWFSVSGNRFPNSFDDRTGNFKLHPQTIKKLIRDGYVEQIGYANEHSRIAKGNYNQWATPKPQIKLKLTEKGQALVSREVTVRNLLQDKEELKARIVELESQLGIAFEIMTDRQISENQHLFNSHIDIQHSGSITKTEGER